MATSVSKTSSSSHSNQASQPTTRKAAPHSQNQAPKSASVPQDKATLKSAPQKSSSDSDQDADQK